MIKDVTQIAHRLLGRIKSGLLETGPDFDIDSDLFAAGLDSMAIMQLTLVIEEDFGAQLPDAMINRETFATARRIAESIASSAVR